jgi:hypothetical protein
LSPVQFTRKFLPLHRSRARATLTQGEEKAKDIFLIEAVDNAIKQLREALEYDKK